MTVAVGDILRASFKWRDVNGSAIMNVWWLKAVGVGTAANSDVMTGIETWLGNIYVNFNTFLDDDQIGDEILVDKVSPTIGPWEVLETVGLKDPILTSFDGEAIGEPLPFGVSALMRLQTPLRRHQGRKYFGGFTEAVNGTDGKLLPAIVTAIAAASFDIMAPVIVGASAVELECVIPVMAGFATNTVNATVVNNIWRSQRRRQPAVGI